MAELIFKPDEFSLTKLNPFIAIISDFLKKKNLIFIIYDSDSVINQSSISHFSSYQVYSFICLKIKRGENLFFVLCNSYVNGYLKRKFHLSPSLLFI